MATGIVQPFDGFLCDGQFQWTERRWSWRKFRFVDVTVTVELFSLPTIEVEVPHARKV